MDQELYLELEYKNKNGEVDALSPLEDMDILYFEEDNILSIIYYGIFVHKHDINLSDTEWIKLKHMDWLRYEDERELISEVVFDSLTNKIYKLLEI